MAEWRRDAPVGTACFVCAYKRWNEDSEVVCAHSGNYGGLGARVTCPVFEPISKEEDEDKNDN